MDDGVAACDKSKGGFYFAQTSVASSNNHKLIDAADVKVKFVDCETSVFVCVRNSIIQKKKNDDRKLYVFTEIKLSTSVITGKNFLLV